MPILELSLYVALGMILFFLKLPISIKLALAQMQFITDVAVFILLYKLHGSDSSVSGTITSAISSLIFAGFLSVYAALKSSKP